ncbi:excalibur calcium-binding domain-containing protein [Erythrobacter aureus]|uniref:excalibur calcium-binding domain-containing protein n=1 Tax=Erythrobacter aureus TaxID=2182384 RepID=UPI003A90E24B|tara:strand:- start:1299 stop:1613 length:315 start_codon:yes stop_codon:yes gene_type:complete
MKGIALLLPLALLTAPPPPALAHPGGLNAQGCHNNRKTGDYHCHRNRRATPQPPTSQIRGGVYFPNCDSARAAGAAPIRRGEAGYRRALDRDNDGVACEVSRRR